jgi:Fe2+ transport system protein B
VALQGKEQVAPYRQGAVDLTDKKAVIEADRKRFEFVNKIVKEVETRKVFTKDKNVQDKVDAVLTNPVGGIAIFAVVMGIVTLLYNLSSLGEHSSDSLDKVLRITVPEDLEYKSAFGDVFEQYTSEASLIGVKTTNLGSLNRLTYSVRLKEAGTEKDLIDDLRVRNGNLEINMMVRGTGEGETL